MTERRSASLRARVRAEMTEEIKEAARRHLAVEGANLSLRAVARDLGMVSSAVYRYFPSRDELLTALIIDAYNSLGLASETADASVTDRADLTGRWYACAGGIRDWARANPHEYALTYGSPVPGYAAPQDTIEPATRPTLVLGAILADGYAAGVIRPQPATEIPAAASPTIEIPASVRGDLGRVVELIAPGVPIDVLARGLIAWTELFGAISFELFGRLTNVIDDLDAWFDFQLRSLARQMGLPDRAS